MDISSMKELEGEIETAVGIRDAVRRESWRAKYAELCAGELDTEPDYENPIESFDDLDTLYQMLDELLVDKVETKVIENEGNDLDPDLVRTEINIEDYVLTKAFFLSC